MNLKDKDRERLLFFRKTRQDLLKNLGLPPDTRPEDFQRSLEEKERSRKAGLVEMFRGVRKKLLASLGLPVNTAPSDVQNLLEVKKAIDQLDAVAAKLEVARKRRP
jgi:predicted house-cleaning NTP pyrophosphatase (Maf/HAM1 superfamily)